MVALHIDPLRLVIAGLVAGVWVTVSGIAMAALFGYREMAAAFSRIGLAVPTGTTPFAVHTLVRLGMGLATVTILVIAAGAFPVAGAIPIAAGLAWLLASFFPYLVMTGWGLFPWRVTFKVWGWSAAEFLIAATIGALVYRP